MGDVDLFDVSIFLKSEKKTDGGKAVNDHRTTAILHSCKKKKKKFHKPLAYAKISSPVEVPPAVNITHFKKRGSKVRSEMCT